MSGPLSIKMYFVYFLQSIKDKRTYIGYTNNITERLKRHNSGQVTATKYRRPLRLLFSEEFETEQEAKIRELYCKNGGGGRKLKELFKTTS